MLRQVVQVFFWPVVIVASLFEAVAAASLTAALFSDPAPRRIFEDEPSHAEIFGARHLTGLVVRPWLSDRCDCLLGVGNGVVCRCRTLGALGEIVGRAARRLNLNRRVHVLAES